MKHLLSVAIIAIALSSLTACNGNKSENELANDQLIAANDSLRTISMQKDSLISLMAEISDGMMQIKDMENLLSASNLTAETPSKKEQIKNDLVLIHSALKARREKIEELEAKRKKSGLSNNDMQKAIESLKAQIAAQEEEINQLKAQLAAANIHIAELNTRVDSLNVVNTNVTNEKVAAQAETKRVTDEMNVCYYVVQTKKELKANKIIETGFLRKTKIMEADYELSSFTKSDKRFLNEINLGSKKAKLYTKHPADSYEIVTEADGMKTLKIKNNNFWSLSNFLVVQID